MKSSVLHVFQRDAGYLRELFEPIEPDKIAVMPKNGDGVALNPPAWLVAHVTVSLSHAVSMLGGDPGIPMERYAKYGMGSAATDNSGDYPNKTELLEHFDKVTQAFVDALTAASDEQLAAPTPSEGFRKVIPTVGGAAVFIGVFHTGVHAGQLTAWRRCMGMGPRF